MSSPENTSTLLVNSVYGVLGSPNFAENNPLLVANNITDLARVRRGLWLMVKSSNASLSVTDGCAAVLNRFPKGKAKPGLDALSGHGKPSISSAPFSSAPLGLKHWSSDELPFQLDELDPLFRKHLKSWVEGFNSSELTRLVDLFGFKVKRIGTGFVMHGAGNYSLTELDGNVVYKMRGHKLDTQHFSPSGTDARRGTGESLTALRANERSSSSFSSSSKHIKIASLGDFKTPSQCRVFAWRYYCAPNPRGITASSFCYPNETLRNKWERRYQTNSQKYGLGLEAAFLDQQGHYNHQHTMALIDKRISDGLGPPNLTKETRAFFKNRLDAEKKALAADIKALDKPTIQPIQQARPPVGHDAPRKVRQPIDRVTDTISSDKISDQVIDQISDIVIVQVGQTFEDFIQVISQLDPTRQAQLIKKIQRVVQKAKDEAPTSGGTSPAKPKTSKRKPKAAAPEAARPKGLAQVLVAKRISEADLLRPYYRAKRITRRRRRRPKRNLRGKNPRPEPPQLR